MSLADTYNLRTSQPSMSDLADLVDTFETVLTWTPAYTYNGTSITLTTLNYAEHMKLAGGKLWFVQASMKVALVGDAAYPTVSLPASMRSGGYKTLTGMIAPNSLAFEPVAVAITGDVATLVRSGAANFTAGTWDFWLSGLLWTT